MGGCISEPAGLRYHALAMNKQYFYLKLIPPRPTFAQDITDEERALMEEHGAYCEQQFDAGQASGSTVR